MSVGVGLQRSRCSISTASVSEPEVGVGLRCSISTASILEPEVGVGWRRVALFDQHCFAIGAADWHRLAAVCGWLFDRHRLGVGARGWRRLWLVVRSAPSRCRRRRLASPQP